MPSLRGLPMFSRNLTYSRQYFKSFRPSLPGERTGTGRNPPPQFRSTSVNANAGTRFKSPKEYILANVYSGSNINSPTSYGQQRSHKIPKAYLVQSLARGGRGQSETVERQLGDIVRNRTDRVGSERQDSAEDVSQMAN